LRQVSKKGPFVDAKLMQRIVGMNDSGQKRMSRLVAYVHGLPEMVGHTIAVHDGVSTCLFVTESMVGTSSASFALTRTIRHIKDSRGLEGKMLSGSGKVRKVRRAKREMSSTRFAQVRPGPPAQPSVGQSRGRDPGGQGA